MGDIPSAGSGMGSSSTVTVGLLNAMYHFLGEPRDARVLAQEACDVEINVLGKPIGMQDQFIAAFGGQRFIRFGTDSTVDVASLRMSERARRRLSDRLMLFFTNMTRKSETVLTEQVNNIKDRLPALREMKCLALQAREMLEAEELDEFGLLLHRGWEFKKTLASGITNGSINAMYEAAREAGALGGKITGAGGGGFLLLYCPPEKQDNVRLALRHLRELPFDLERDGTKVIFNYRR
jgi:D-glycero-alpha-D-manno-heptose-7-phosphate kinase